MKIIYTYSIYLQSPKWTGADSVDQRPPLGLQCSPRQFSVPVGPIASRVAMKTSNLTIFGMSSMIADTG